MTLSIAKTAQPAPGECKRFYYNEEVCRPSRESHTFQTIHQMGLECMGAVDAAAQGEVVRLALQSLAALPVPTVLEVSHMGLSPACWMRCAPRVRTRPPAGPAGPQKRPRLRAAAQGAGLDAEAADALCALLALHGPLGATLTAARAACRCEAQRAALEELQALQNQLGEDGRGVQLDLSLADEMEYYNGLVFHGYVAGAPRAVLKGGRYDYLMQRFTPGANAIGFALYIDELERPAAQDAGAERTWLNIALPKGRLGDKAYALLAAAGYRATRITTTPANSSSKTPTPACGTSSSSPATSPSMSSTARADIGIAGKDILPSRAPTSMNCWTPAWANAACAWPGRPALPTTRAARCASPPSSCTSRATTTSAAAATSTSSSSTVPCELAPILGLADVIVDIVETAPPCARTT